MSTAPRFPAATRPDRHCFREDNCADHPDHDGDECCCCGWLAEAHSGCDCPDDTEAAAIVAALLSRR